MTDATADAAEEPQKGSKKGLIIGLVLALVGGGAGFFVTSSGLLGGGGPEKPAEKSAASADVVFLPIDPITVAIGSPSEGRFLRFHAQLEVPAAYEPEVSKLLPRIVDVLNTYLRSVTMADVENPAALLTLRAQLRRRLDLVVGGDKINDLLVMEFVVN